MLVSLAVAVGGVIAGSFFLFDHDDDSEQPEQKDGESVDGGMAVTLDLSLLDSDVAPSAPAVSTDLSSDLVLGDRIDEPIVSNAPFDDQTASGYTNVIGQTATFVAEEGEFHNVHLGGGNEYLEVNGSIAHVVTGVGEDTVDASGLTGGEIHAGMGDVVYGSDIVSDTSSFALLAVNAHGAEFHGGDANELAVATGHNAILYGGGGNDHLLAFEGDVELRGGAGDDWLIGNATSENFDQNSRVSDINTLTNSSFDTLIGGEGDDHLLLSNGDIGVGGAGADSFEVYHLDNAVNPAAQILDFSPSEDALVVYLGGGAPGAFDDASYDLTDRVESIGLPIGTDILVDGEVVASIEGVAELHVGIPIIDQVGEGSASSGLFMDVITGDVAGIDSFDVIVKVFPSTSS
ncbi:hypothetical protein [Tateyamaria sp. ANG-S1]|uniref:calcium-binding protein n=1 Tax=Tateyamaria sp. ANG-S1 TaxID=1577905 RepID=UPI0005804BEA|nr:hypothetical protein [Tateyamaria sp. ANG-S1]KIC48210.1 hypothetical protein RA29_16850 [Tateyamaria sp. ANG-S1]